jgi:beta-1,4-mannosyl-glycoprotein beta-1,4-N-acetylglucosaminyltransferase
VLYDCFTFYNELELLELRLPTLDGLVDRFVLAEARHTHQGDEKPLYFDENRAAFARWLPRIEHVIVEFPEELPATTWARENYQRRSLHRGLLSAAPNDRVLVGDLDELPSPTVLERVATLPGLSMLKLRTSYYWIDYVRVANDGRSPYNCLAPYVAPVRIVPDVHQMRERVYRLRGIDSTRISRRAVNQVRRLIMSLELRAPVRVVDRAGWHLSYLGGIERIQQKLRSCAHDELVTDERLDSDSLSRLIDAGRNITGGDDVFQRMSIDDSFPPPVVEDPGRYRALLVEGHRQ